MTYLHARTHARARAHTPTLILKANLTYYTIDSLNVNNHHGTVSPHFGDTSRFIIYKHNLPHPNNYST